MPSIPTSPRASLTSSNLKGLMIASIFFMRLLMNGLIQSLKVRDTAVPFSERQQEHRVWRRPLSNRDAKGRWHYGIARNLPFWVKNGLGEATLRSAELKPFSHQGDFWPI